MKSIIQKDKSCWYCGTIFNLEEHHIFYGTANRRNSEKYGLKVYLCAEHHRGNNGVHRNNKELDKTLKRLAQRKFEETHKREEFIRIFGKSVL